MRLFMTPAGEAAWYSALVRNVRMQITRFEIGVLDVFSLSGNKASGKTTQQFRSQDYAPDWEPDFNALRATDTVVYEGTTATMGYWRINSTDGGLIFRVPANVADMDIGNVRVYAKNTGPYPYATPGAQAYKRYEEVVDDDNGGEVLLCVGFASVADTHWKAETQFPHSLDIRLAIHADGIFNILDRTQFAFEGVVNVYEAPTEAYLKTNAANAYNVAVVATHSKTGRPAVFYRGHGQESWVGYPLHENFLATLEDPIPIADANIDSELLDFGTLNPPAIDPTDLGVVISTQPRQITLNTMSFIKKDVASWTAQTTPQTITLLPNTGQSYTTIIRIADLAFVGLDQQLYFVHNGTRYRLCARGKAYDTPPIAFNNGDTVYLEATLNGPVSSLTGTIYASLNEAPISADPNNTSVWMVGKISTHISSTVIPQPKHLSYGLTGRRIGVYTWSEYTPQQYVTGLGYDMYGVPNTASVTVRVKPSASGAGGTSFGYGGGQLASDTRDPQSYLKKDYTDPEGNKVIRRGITGLEGTRLAVLKNGTVVDNISTPVHVEGSCTFTVAENDRISFIVELIGQPHDSITLQREVLAGMALSVEGIVNASGIPWLDAKFDLATTFGPDLVPPITGTLPSLPAPPAIPQTVASYSFNDMTDNFFINSNTLVVPNGSTPYIAYGPWLALMTSPNPTIQAANIALSVFDLVITGVVNNDLTVELEKFNGWNAATSIVLISNGVIQTGLQLTTVNSEDCYRIKVTHEDPNVRIQTTLRIATDTGNKDLLIDSTVRSS